MGTFLGGLPRDKAEVAPVRRRSSSWAASRTTGSLSPSRPTKAGTTWESDCRPPRPDCTSPHQGCRVLNLSEVARTMSAPPTLGQRDRPRHFRNLLPDRHDAPSLVRRLVNQSKQLPRVPRAGLFSSGVAANSSQNRRKRQCQSHPPTHNEGSRPVHGVLCLPRDNA